MTKILKYCKIWDELSFQSYFFYDDLPGVYYEFKALGSLD